MSASEHPSRPRGEDDTSPLSPEEKLERAYLHVTEAMATEGEDPDAAPLPETIGILPPSAEQYERQLAEMKDQLLRSAAEMENVRRRAQKDVEDASRYALAGFGRDLVSVIENLHRAAASIPLEARATDPLLKNLAEGVDMTLREFTGVIEKNGIRRLNPLGEAFDHNFHQAVSQVESAEHTPGTIAHVLQAGYVLHDRLLMPAMVGVFKAPVPQAPAPHEMSRIDTQA